MDRVLPDVPVRQWVLTLPVPVRFVLLRHPELVSPVLGIFLGAVFAWLRRRARARGVAGGHPGSASAQQRFGDGGRCHLHIHSILLDGVYHRPDPAGAPVFVPLPAPTREDLAHLVVQVQQRVMRLLRRRDLCPDELEPGALGGAEEAQLLMWQAAAMQGRVAVGPRAGWRVVRVGDVPVAVPPPGKGLCAEAQGFNIHAGVHVAAGRREQLERLCRYVMRPPFAQERLARLPDGRVRVRLKRPWPDGTRALIYEPLDFLSKICALVPPPRRHLVHYHGVLGPNSKWRAEVVPEPDGAEPESPPGPPGPDRPAYRMSWAEMRKRTFAEDVLACPCGGRKRFLCFVFDPGALAAIAWSLGIGGRSEEPGTGAHGPLKFEMDLEAG